MSRTAHPMLVLACGCAVPFVDGETPQCSAHGRSRVVRTRDMPAPRIRGAVTGPHAVTMELGSFHGRFAGSDGQKDS